MQAGSEELFMKLNIKISANGAKKTFDHNMIVFMKMIASEGIYYA